MLQRRIHSVRRNHPKSLNLSPLPPCTSIPYALSKATIRPSVTSRSTLLLYHVVVTNLNLPVPNSISNLNGCHLGYSTISYAPGSSSLFPLSSTLSTHYLPSFSFLTPSFLTRIILPTIDPLYSRFETAHLDLLQPRYKQLR